MVDAPHPDAVLKDYKGLEVWEWREDGVLKLELTGHGVLEDYQTDALAGEKIEVDHYALVVGGDCDVYKPRTNDLLAMFNAEDSVEDRLLISFRKNVIPKDLCKMAAENLRKAASKGDNRGMAAGKVDQEKLRTIAKEGEIVLDGKGVRARYRQPDGTLSTTTAANRVLSGIAGNFDATPRHPFCRQTGYSRSNPGPMNEVIPFLEAVSNRFKVQAPYRWQLQKNFVDDTGIFPHGWCLGDTVFTTITVNKNWRTAVHKDAGDFLGGYGNLTVIEGDPYTGGFTGFPKYRLAVDVRTGDFLAMDVHEWHGNTKMVPVNQPPAGEEWSDPDGENPGFERISVVCYARFNMRECGPLSEEKLKYDAWIAKFLSPKKVQALQLQQRQDEQDQINEEIAYLQHLFEEEL